MSIGLEGPPPDMTGLPPGMPMGDPSMGMPPPVPGMPPGMMGPPGMPGPMGMPMQPPTLMQPPPPGVGIWTHLWMLLIATEDVSKIASEFDYRVEAASSRKPNRDKMVADLNDMGQVLMQIVQPLIMANPANIQLLNWYWSKMAESRDTDPPPPIQPPLPPPMPPQQAGPPQGPPPPQ